jgi:hypothetical protein
MDPTQIRMRYLILILLAAFLTAALLRHTLHVEGGLTRKQIWAAALVALAIGTNRCRGFLQMETAPAITLPLNA